MMYKIRIEEILAKNVYVEAEDEVEAINKVTDLYRDEKIVLSADDYYDTNIERVN